MRHGSSWAILILLSSVSISGCEPTVGVFSELPFVSAQLTDELFAGDSRCRFTLRMRAEDERATVSYAWEIDRTRSTIPELSDAESSDTGSFTHQASQVWEWRRPDNGPALILLVRYQLEAGEHSAGGRLLTYCP